MKVLALDYGEKKIGLAISDDLGIIASPMAQINVKSVAEAVGLVHTICHKNNVNVVLIGLPLGEKGEETQQSIQVRYFARSLQDTDGIQVEFWDESFSTKIAESSKNLTAKKKKNLDSEAARIILQEYLDSRPSKRNNNNTSPMLSWA